MARKDPKGEPAPMKRDGTKNEGLLVGVLTYLIAFLAGGKVKVPPVPKGFLGDLWDEVREAVGAMKARLTDLTDRNEALAFQNERLHGENENLRRDASRLPIWEAIRTISTFAERWNLDGSSDWIRDIAIKHGSAATASMYFFAQARNTWGKLASEERMNAFLDDIMEGAPSDHRWIENGGKTPHSPFPKVRMLFVGREGPK